MYQFVLVLLAVSTALGVSVGTGHAASSLRDTLGERFKLSRIEVQNPSGEGHVIKKGTVLSLQADGIPANPLRVVQLNSKSPRFHVADYARVEVDREGRLKASPGELALAKGTRLAILDLKVGADRVRAHPRADAAARRQGRVRLRRVRLRLRSSHAGPSGCGDGRWPDQPVALHRSGRLGAR